MPAIPDLGALVEAVQDAQVTGLDGLLGEGHWKRGAVASAALLGETPGADAAVVFLFALLHDTMRLHDGYDPAHGWRAAWLTYDPDARSMLSELTRRRGSVAPELRSMADEEREGGSKL